MKSFLKKHISLILILLILTGMSFFYSGVAVYSMSKYNGITIVLDAGHGGRDGGSVGVGGTVEKTINLEYVLLLKEKLVKDGFKVELTRKNDDGLYSATSKNKKLSDMNERLKIIKRANPNLVVSVHMNSFVDSSAKGAMTYFRKGDMASQKCADLIQASLSSYCGARHNKGKVGDYFMVNSSYYTAVLVECGFLSNPEEEVLLNSDYYKNLLVDAIYKGILLYFGNTGI